MAEKETKISEKLRESLEQAQARLSAFEEEAQRVLQDLVEKGRATRKEVGALIQKVNAQELIEKGSGRARHVSEDMTRRLDDVRQRVIALAGVASRDQVEELASDLDKLSRKLDKLLATGGKKAPAAKKPAKR